MKDIISIWIDTTVVQNYFNYYLNKEYIVVVQYNKTNSK